MATAKTATPPATANPPEGAPATGEGTGAPSDDHLRNVIREELSKVLHGEDPEDLAPDDPEGEDEANLSLREITNRALKMTTKALDKIPGAKGADAAPAEPAEPGPETVPAQISRGMRLLGFGDPE